MDSTGHAALLELLEGAVTPAQYQAAHPSRSSPPKPTNLGSTSSGEDNKPSDITRDGVAAVRHLLDNDALSLAGYEDWIRLGFAFKHSFGEQGFAPWLAFSEAADGFKSEEDCRRAWDGITEPADGRPLTVATYIARAKEIGWKPSPRTKTSTDTESGGRLPKGTDAASHAVALSLEAGDEFWVDQDGKPHVTYEAHLAGGGTVARHTPVAGETYRAVLQNRFHAAVESKVLTGDHATLAIQLLSFKAIESEVQHVAALRVGENAGHIYVDLGRPDGKVAEVDPAGWRVVDSSPVRFVRGIRGELPEPVDGGKLADFQAHFNLEPDDLLRLVGFLVGTFNVGGSYSILLTDGEHGAGKSTLNDKAVSLIDPPRKFKGGRMAFNVKERDLHIGALGVHVPYFDNVSSFSGEAADALCRMSTGGGSGARTLYENTGYTEISVIRPIIVTSIGAPSSRPDLLSRAVRITALPLAGHRRTERRIIAKFEADRPKLFGFLLTCVSAALRNRDAIEAAVDRGEIELPRMADFAEWVEGAHEMLGLPVGGFSKLLDDSQSAMQTEAALGSPVGSALVSYFSEAGSPPLNARASEIIEMLRGRLPVGTRLPAANMLGKALSRISVGLRALGVEWSVTAAAGHDNVQIYQIRVTDIFQPSPTTIQLDGDDGGGHF